MNELMGAHLYRLKRDKVFWLCTIAMLILSVAVMLNGCRQSEVMMSYGYQTRLERYYFTLAPAVGLFAGVFSGLFLGTEYADGAVRSKLIVGHSRRQIYLATLAVNILAAVLITVAWLTGGLIGIPFFGLWEMGVVAAALHILVAFGSAIALAAIFTLFGMLATKKSTSAVGTLLLFLALLLVASLIYNKLLEPELRNGILWTIDGMLMEEPTPNPNYVGGIMRTVLELILDILPTGQEALLTNGGIVRPVLNVAASVAVTVLTTVAGMALFEKKDLK